MNTAKRRDSKGRILNDGEYQKATGQYEYRYYDKFGKSRSVYSWRLTATDKIPEGKRKCRPLRDLEREIEEAVAKSKDYFTCKTATLNDRYDIWIKKKIGLRATTRNNYIYMYENYVRKTLGTQKLISINYSVVQAFYNDLIVSKGFKPNSMEVIHTILNPIFEDARTDEIITFNPCTKAMKEIRSSPLWEKSKRVALTKQQQSAFTSFMKSNPKYSAWVNVITVLLGTGLRIGELNALTWDDIDFENGYINVSRSMAYRQWEDGKCCYHLMSAPKTENGVRAIPMFDATREALLNQKAIMEASNVASPIIDGVDGWIFTNRFGNILSPSSINDAINRISRDYNDCAKTNPSMPDMPHITNHVLRHTFCTRLMESGMNIKVIQSIMGHADFSTTMDIYTDVEKDFVKDTAVKFDGEVFIV